MMMNDTLEPPKHLNSLPKSLDPKTKNIFFHPGATLTWNAPSPKKD